MFSHSLAMTRMLFWMISFSPLRKITALRLLRLMLASLRISASSCHWPPTEVSECLKTRFSIVVNRTCSEVP